MGKRRRRGHVLRVSRMRGCLTHFEMCAPDLNAREEDNGNSNLKTILISYFASHRSYGYITMCFYGLFGFFRFFKNNLYSSVWECKSVIFNETFHAARFN